MHWHLCTYTWLYYYFTSSTYTCTHILSGSLRHGLKTPPLRKHSLPNACLGTQAIFLFSTHADKVKSIEQIILCHQNIHFPTLQDTNYFCNFGQMFFSDYERGMIREAKPNKEKSHNVIGQRRFQSQSCKRYVIRIKCQFYTVASYLTDLPSVSSGMHSSRAPFDFYWLLHWRPQTESTHWFLVNKTNVQSY